MNMTDPTEILQKVLDAAQRGIEAAKLCQSVNPDELVKALEKHTNQEGVQCLETTMKYSNEV